MANKALYLRVGVLLAVGIIMAIGLVLFLSRDLVRNGWKFESYFSESVQGLDVGAPVKYRGVTLGQVTDIALVSAAYPESMANQADSSYQLVVVRYTVDPKKTGSVATPARAVEIGLRARLASQGLTGLAYIELDFVNPRQFPAETVPWTPSGDVIPSMPSTFAQVQDAAQALLAKLQAVDLVRLTTGLQTLLDDVHADVTQGDVHTTMIEAQLLLRTLRATMEQANLPAMTADLQATSASVRNLVQGKQMNELMGSATLAADRFAAAAQRLPQVVSALEAAVKRADNGVGDLLHEVEPALRDARAAAANLRETSETLRRYPSSILLGAPPPRENGK
jgi:phospholipid/cholesterol/gamma-HCH transport system substrate-binding protein